jgi:formyltetrahydrofolate hydrolase
MTTLTIQLPDSEIGVIAAISDIIKNAGGNIVVDNDDLAPAEFELLQEAYKEALLIKDSLKKPIPVSQLWHD